LTTATTVLHHFQPFARAQRLRILDAVDFASSAKAIEALSDVLEFLAG